MSFLRFFVLVCVAVSAEAAAVPEQRDCGDDFRSKLRELMDIKRSCPSAFYESCCQVKIVYNYKYLAVNSRMKCVCSFTQLTEK